MLITFSHFTVLSIFYAVFLSQILLVSVFFPTQIRRRILYVLDHFPPAEYPKLYPCDNTGSSAVAIRERMRIYRFANTFIAAIGLVFLAGTAISGYQPSPKGGDEIFVFLYFALQVFPFLYLARMEYLQLKALRKNYTGPRRADMRPRRLFDFVSPLIVVLAILLYFVWLFLFLSYQGSPAEWGTKVYISVTMISAINIFYAFFIYKSIYGKKIDPYQASEDRLRNIEFIAKSLIFTSITISIFMITTQAVDHFELEIFDPPLMSVYLQMCSLMGIGLILTKLKVEDMNFEAYRGDANAPDGDQ
ncbi:MAG: hypothetical protein H6510_16105 [Acidobacteria bacterium]|nr:hypothetical protein [Acidobacteriota bacterium]MCB9399337.1 hypothetical protein [Acidobacteriota bacterium]